MLEASPRWNRQRLAVLEAVESDLKRLFTIVYMISGASAAIYVGGWLRFNLLDLPVGPIPAYTLCALILTAVAGVLHAAMLPAVAVSLGVERLLRRKLKQTDVQVGKAKDHRLIAVQSLPTLCEDIGGSHGQHHHSQLG